MKFTDLGLRPEILSGLAKMGYVDLTPVQEQTFADILAGKDLLAKAETGSGKTGACGIPLVQRIDDSQNCVQALIIVPTRELALQYVTEIADITRQTKIQPFAVYGGFSIDIQKSKLDHGVHVLVATPGRLIDLLRNSTLSLSQVSTFVLDEADEMLNMGFADDIEFVFSCLIHEHQTLLFSATMPKTIQKLAETYLKDPVILELNQDDVAPQSLTHHFQQIKSHQRRERLEDYLKKEKPKQAIIFCNSRLGGIKLLGQLKKDIRSIDMIHGGLEQSKRSSLFNRFRRNEIKLLVATDIASRGLDFSHVSHVINFEMPRTSVTYTHRTGRTARMGREGVAMTFFTSQEIRDLKTLLSKNRISPVWHGQEPDFDHLPAPHQQKRRPNYRGEKKHPAKR
jgi:ATP-dependent RNA helicase DeaD